MQVTVNGSNQEVEAGTTVGELVAAHDLEPVRVAVEVNARLVPRGHFDDTRLCAGDQVEIVTLFGGG